MAYRFSSSRSGSSPKHSKIVRTAPDSLSSRSCFSFSLAGFLWSIPKPWIWLVCSLGLSGYSTHFGTSTHQRRSLGAVHVLLPVVSQAQLRYILPPPSRFVSFDLCHPFLRLWMVGKLTYRGKMLVDIGEANRETKNIYVLPLPFLPSFLLRLPLNNMETIHNQ